MMKEYLMGIDNGGTVSKTVIFDLEGKEIASASRKINVKTPKPLHNERDMEELWQKNCEAIREAMEKADIDAGQIRGISLSGHGKGLYLWGKEEDIVYNGILSTDRRAYQYSLDWHRDGTAKKIFKKTYQRIQHSQPIALLKWIKDNEAEVLEKTRWIFGVKDYIRYRLTDEAYGEITDFSGSNLINLDTRTYDKEILNDLGLEDLYDKLPPLKGSVDLCGSITKEAAEKTGLAMGTPVSAGMFDIDACAIAMNIVDEDYIAVIGGTWGINEYISRTPVINDTTMNSLYCYGDYYLIEESSATSASNLEWYIEVFLKELKLDYKEEGKNIYDYTNDLVQNSKFDKKGVIFLPYIYGSNYDAKSKATFVGMDSHHKREDLVRAVYEGIVFCHKVHLDKLLENKGNVKAIRLAGGVTNSKVWVQMFADILNLPIEVIQTKELGALGAAMAAGVVSGIYPNLYEASNRLSKVVDRIEPNEKMVSLYKDKYETYKKVSEQLADIWDEFN